MIIFDEYTIQITNGVATITFGSAVVLERIHRIVNLTQKEVIYNTETSDLKTQASLEGGVLFTFGITPKNLKESDLLAIEYIETSGGGGGGGGDASSANQVAQTNELIAIKNKMIASPATEATNLAILAELRDDVYIQSTIWEDRSSVVSVFYREERIRSQDDGTISTVYTRLSDNIVVGSLPAGSVPVAGATDRAIEFYRWKANGNGTGYTVGDWITNTIVFDTGGSGEVLSSTWYNLSTSATISAPINSHLQDPNEEILTEIRDKIIATPATEGKQDDQIAELVAIKNAVEGELEVSIVGTQTTSFAPDPKNFNTTTKDSAKFDSVGNLKSRSAVFTDEGSFRYDFEGTSLTKPITGLLDFSNTNETVLGVGTLFLSELQKGLYIKVTTDVGTFWRQVIDVISDTELLIDRPYPSATSGSVCHYAWVSFNQGTGATITNANSVATMALGTSPNTSSRISRTVDYPAVVGSALVSVSQRIANQDVYIGFSEQSTSLAKYFAWFRLNGTNAQSIILETCGVKEGVPVTADIEAQTITLPAGLTTSKNLLYRVEVKDQRIRFFINEIQVGRDFKTHIPSNYDVLGWGVVGINGAPPPASNTNVNIDYYNVNNSNEIAIYNSSLSESFLAEQPYFEEFGFNQTGVIAVNTDLLVIDCSQYRSLSIQCTSMGTSGVITPQWTNDPTLALASRVTATLFDQAGAVSTTFNTAVLRVTNVMARYLVLRLTTATTAGTTNLIVNGSHFPTQTFFGTQPVNGTVGANKSGTWALDAGTNLMGDVGIQYRANATGASSKFHLVSATSANASIIKASAGRVIGWHISNTSASWRYVKLHNQATTPSSGVGVVQTIGIPPNSTVNYSQGGGIAFTTGIAMTTVTGASDNDSNAVAIQELIIDIFFA